jgi:hypothetical protein
MASTTPSSFKRLLRVVGAEAHLFTLKNGDPDPTGRACIIRHRTDQGGPDVVWWFEDPLQIEGWWRRLGDGWKAKQVQLEAVAQHYRDASPDERQGMRTWAALTADQRVTHPWTKVFESIERRYTNGSVTLPRAWRGWTMREYIKSASEAQSDDPVGDVIAACVTEESHQPSDRSFARRRAGR